MLTAQCTNIGMAKPLRVVLDTNVLVSAIVYGGKPRQILERVLSRDVKAIISPVLLVEILDVLSKKFHFPDNDLSLIEYQLKKNSEIVKPKQTINILRDDADNRVLEAAVAGRCRYIVTGDKEILSLGSFRRNKILTPSRFLEKLIGSVS